MTLQEHFTKDIVPQLKKELELTNSHSVPCIRKIVLSVGIPVSQKDSKILETVEQNLERITGQKPVRTKAKKSIANFKIREGMVVGVMVTLRGPRMWDFLGRLINVTFPRIRDFRGLSPKLVDAQGNVTIGFREHLAFPEIRSDEVEKIHGLQVTITTTAGTRERGFKLLKALGFPWQTA